MQAYVLSGPDRGAVDEVPDPVPGPRDVVVEVAATGLCGSDLHLSDFPGVRLPLVPGHEFAGRVVAVGSDVRAVAADDRVAVNPSLSCGTCRWCRRGRPNLCASYGALGVTVDGGFARYASVPEYNCYRVPDGVDDAAAALAEPLACVVHGVERLDPELGDSCLIVGAGAIGLLLLQVLVRRGVGSVVVVDRDAARLALARRLGATATHAAVTDAMARAEDGYDCVVDATGVPAAIGDGLRAVTRGGKLLLFGVAPPAAQLPVTPFDIYNDELTVLGSMSVAGAFPPALELLAAGVIDVPALVTSLHGIAAVPEAYDLLRGAGALKVHVRP